MSRELKTLPSGYIQQVHLMVLDPQFDFDKESNTGVWKANMSQLF